MEHVPQKKDNSRLVLAIALILIGVFWILKKLGFYIEFQPFFYENIFYPFNNFFHHWNGIIFSWPMILIIVGIVLLAGRRKGGVILLIIGSVFLLPKLFLIHGITATILLPLILIGVGVAMVTRLI
jgi:hypothetical protein